MERQEVEALRLQLLENGYTPIRNIDKRTFMTAWPSVTITPDEIKTWTRKFSRQDATGLRIENGLCAIDFDVDDEAAMTAIVDAVLDAHPGLGDAMLRWGKGFKEAWFVRCDEIFTRLHTRAFVKPGQVADDGTHRVEIFGGGSPRQFGAFGAHTRADSGEVLVSYEWADGVSPLTVPLSEAVSVAKADMWSVIDIAERVLLDLGWSVHERSTRGESASGKVYDLTPDMVFHCSDDVTRTLDELRDAAQTEDHLRCSASWLEGPTAVNTSRCLVSLARSGGVAIWESMEGVTHHDKVDEPIDYGPQIDRVAEKLLELKERRRTKINAGDEFTVAGAKLLNGFAYCATQKLSAVPLWATSLEEGYQMQAFRLLFAPNCMVEKGPRGGEKRINPVDYWMASEKRITVDGMRMRPDRERPLFTDDGKQYVNVYSPPAHTAEGGDPMPGVRFIEHLVPDPDERHWFLCWLAFKLRFPHIPGPAVLMVAHATFGTGRGTLAELVARLFGQQYVRQLTFDDFTGKTYQSQYNEWQAEALVVCVNESSESDGGSSSYQTKRNTYEHLKEIVEVRPTVRDIKRKGDRNTRLLSCTSFLVFTNHIDALPLPEHDRRFGVVRNGEARPVEYWDKLNKWMEDPANVAAMFDWLEGYDIGNYSPYATPPMFRAKAEMIDEAKSGLDHAMDLALANMPGAIFTFDQLEKYVKAAADDSGLDLPRPLTAVFRKVAKRRTVRVGERNGKNWQPQIDGKRHAIFASDNDTAATWTYAGNDEVRAELARNGNADGGGSNLLVGFFNKHAK